MILSRCLRLPEVARIMGISLYSVRQLVAAGRLPVVRPLGEGPHKPVLATEEDVARLIEESKVTRTRGARTHGPDRRQPGRVKDHWSVKRWEAMGNE